MNIFSTESAPSASDGIGHASGWTFHRRELPRSAWRDLWTPLFMTYTKIYNSGEYKIEEFK